MQEVKIFIVVPVFNENEVLKTTIAPLLSQGYNVVVVDDGSHQPQNEFLSSLPVFYLRHKVNLGQGAALQTGSTFSVKHGADIIVHFDADGQHTAEDIPILIKPLTDNKTDVVFGSRFMQTSSTNISFGKKIVLQIGRYVNFILTGILLTDAHNGLRAFTKTAAQKIDIKENRMAHASEILFLVKKNKLRYREVPVQIHYSNYSKKKGQKGYHGIRILYDLLLNKFFE